MGIETIEQEFKLKVCEQVQLSPEGMNRYRVFTPFLLEDGDHIAIIFKRENGHWILSDEGHTYMHLTYDIEEKSLQTGTRQKIITNALSGFSVEDRDGELVLRIENNLYGDALYSFVQALLRISDVTYLSRERARSTFMDDFRAFMLEQFPEPKLQFDWHNPKHDPEGKYPVDCYVNSMARPLVIYGVPGDDKVRDTTISLLQFERWGETYRSIGIFEDQEEINRKVLARFSDVCEKQFSNLASNKERIVRYLKEATEQ